MAQTLYASFADAALAEKAAGALLDYGVRQEDISLVSSGDHGQTQTIQGVRAQVADVPAMNAGARANMMAGNADTVQGSPGRVANTAGTGAAGNFGTIGTTDPVVNAENADSDVSNALENAAKHGITTTTAADAGSGAIKGTGIGLVLGAIAAFVVPGIGWALGGGALASALGATALAAGAGAIAGGVTGYLKDQGVPSEEAERYHGTLQQGGALLALHLPSGKVTQTLAEPILVKYGGFDVKSY